jgi:hypothetical protein
MEASHCILRNDNLTDYYPLSTQLPCSWRSEFRIHKSAPGELTVIPANVSSPIC